MHRPTRRRFLCTALGAGGSLGLGAAWLTRRPAELQSMTVNGWALGAEVSITVLDRNRRLARRAADAALAELALVEEVASLYRDDSQLARLNLHGVLTDPHPYLIELFDTAATLSRRTGGAFDVTVQPLWQLHEECRAQGRLPGDDALNQAVAQVDWRRVECSRREVRLRGTGTAVTLNGVAQGLAADRATAVLRSFGIEHALVDAGEIGSLGAKAEGEAWTVGIQDPWRPEAWIDRVALAGRALATSGDYAGRLAPGQPDRHLFDPSTGHSSGALAGVSVAAPTAMEADALSTAVFVLGPQKGLALIARTPGADAFFVYPDGRTLATESFPTAI